MKFSFFNRNNHPKPAGSLTLDAFLNSVKTGTWAKPIAKLRAIRGNPSRYKALKGTLPGATLSALVTVRLANKVKEHSGLLCVDIDKKDNPKLKTGVVVDRDCIAQFVSPGGEGLKIVYRCAPTLDPAIHRRTYDAIQTRLIKKGISITLDPVVKSIVSLQYVSHDPDLYRNDKTKLVIKPLPPIKRKVVKANPDVAKELDEYIERLGKKDVTENYEDWLNVLFGLSHALGESGRAYAHKICRNYKGYSKEEVDEKYDGCLDTDHGKNPITIATVFQLLADGMSKPNAKQLQRKYNKNHAIGKAEEVTEGPPELIGLVRFGLWLFKPILDKKTNAILDLVPSRLNLNAFEKLLGDLGFARYERYFVHNQGNIVDVVDTSAILYRVTKEVEAQGSYEFEYKGTTYNFGWEDLAHRWREIRALSTTANQIAASLPFWVPNVLKDKPNESYIPYQNGVVVVNAKTIALVPYDKIDGQVWRERILPRNFKYDRTRGMFEDFFINVMGRGDTPLQKTRSEHYRRAIWYYGYILQGTKRQSTARAWLLYDVKTGNNGRSGKTIIGSAVGQIRSVAVIDGKRVDLSDRFAFQTIKPWTDVIFIEDPKRTTTLDPLFNIISGTTTADRKGIDPIERSLKVLIASNWFLESGGTSETGRQFVSQLDDFYVRYAKENGDTIQPLVDLHGKEFFTDWDDQDWNRFDSFSMRALQSHFHDAPPKNTQIGNAAQMRFIQVYEEETFYELCVSLIQNAKPSLGGSAIVCGLLVQVVKDHAPDIRKPGIVVKEFLRSLGATNLRPTTVRIGSGPKTAYVWDEPLPRLNWNGLRKSLPRIPETWSEKFTEGQ